MRTHAQNKNGHNIQPGKGKHMKDPQGKGKFRKIMLLALALRTCLMAKDYINLTKKPSDLIHLFLERIWGWKKHTTLKCKKHP